MLSSSSRGTRRRTHRDHGVRRIALTSLVGVLLLTLLGATTASATIDRSREFPGWNVYSEGGANVTHFTDTTVKKVGTASLKLVNATALTGGKYGGVAQGFSVAPNTTYQFSAWVKGQSIAADSGANFTNTIIYTADSTGRKTLPTGTFDWQQVTWSFTTAANQTTLPYVLISQNTGTLWLDGLTVVKQGTTTDLLVNGGFENSNDQVTILNQSLIFAPGQASLSLSGSASPVAWKVLDRNNLTVSSGSVAISAGPGTVSLSSLPVGYYTLSLTAGDHTTLSSLAVVAGHGTAYAAPKPLGTTIHPLGHPTINQGVLAGQLNLGVVRMDMRWENVEKTAGVYTFDATTDGQVTSLQNAGAKVSVILGYYNPLYDNGRTPSTPAGITAFANYAKAVAQHYGAAVDYEVYNEPNVVTNTSLCGQTALCYRQLVTPAITEIRAAAPGARIVGPSLGGLTNYWLGASASALAWMKDFCDQGGLALVDIIAMHNYATPSAPEGGSGDAVAAVRSLINSYPGGSSKLLWLGETGWPTVGSTQGGVDEDQEAKYFVRDIPMVLAAGASQYMFYDLIDDYNDAANPEGRFGTVRNETETKGAIVPKPAWVALEVFSRQFSGFTYASRDSLGTGVYSYRFTNASGAVKRIMWAPGGASVQATVSGNPVVTEYLGTARTLVPESGKVRLQLTDEPVYLSGTVSAVAVASPEVFPVTVPAQSLQYVPIQITVGVNNTGNASAPTGAVTFTASTGQSVTVASTPNASTTGTITVPAFSDTGAKRITVTATRGSQLRAVRYASTTVVENPRAVLIPVTTAGGTSSNAAVLRIAYGTTTAGVTVQTVNWSIGTLSGTLSPGTAFTNATADVVLPATGLPLWKPLPYTVTFTLSDGRTKTVTGTTAFAPSYLQGGSNLSNADLATSATYVSAGGSNAGPSDLSGTMAVTHDATYLNVFATITDDVQNAGPDAAQLYLGDSIQFGFESGLPASGQPVSEFGAALLPSGPVVYRYSGTQGVVTSAVTSITRNETTKTTQYVIRIPYAETGLTTSDTYAGYSFLVNDNDGTGRKGFLQWGAGIGSSKDSGAYLPIQILN